MQAMVWRGAPLQEAIARMGFNGLREPQIVPIDAVLAGRDVLVVLPTSGGKSAIYVLPTLACQWKTLVFSPLIALMRDQVLNLRAKGIKADYINSSRTPAEVSVVYSDWMQGHVDLLYIAPERLQRPDFISLMASRPPDMVAVDEVHCLSQWSDIFRPSYCLIGDFVERFNPKVVVALTATCNDEIESDVYRVLGLPNMSTIWRYYERSNLNLTARDMTSFEDIIGTIKEIEGKVVVYFSTVARLEKHAPILQRRLGENVGLYHGKLDRNLRSRLQDEFKSGQTSIMTATSAFGMGVDIPDIRGVIHHDPPGTPEALVQELGRAGRDEQASWCTSFQHPDGWRTQRNFIEAGYPTPEKVKAVYKVYERHGMGGQYIKMTIKEVAEKAGVTTFGMDSLINLLLANKVLVNTPMKDRIARVSFLTDPDPSTHRRLANFKGVVERTGERTAQGSWAFDMDLVRHELDVQEATMRAWLNQWSKPVNPDCRDSLPLIVFKPPFAGKIKMLGAPLSVIDFDFLQAKAAKQWQKLKITQAYFDVIPDSEKHDFFKAYFENELERVLPIRW